MTRYERFVLWLNRFYHKQNKITICVLYTLIMAILGVLIYGATHQQASSSISVKYTRPFITVNFNPNGGEFGATGGGVSSKLVRLGDTYGDLPIPTMAGYSFVGWKFNDEYITSTTQNVTTVEHTLTAIWNTNLFTSDITSDYTGCAYNFTTNTLTFNNATSLAAGNYYTSFKAYILRKYDDLGSDYLTAWNFGLNELIGVYSFEFVKPSGYNYLNIRSNTPYKDPYFNVNMTSWANVTYIVRFEYVSSTPSTINNQYAENFIIKNIEIYPKPT